MRQTAALLKVVQSTVKHLSSTFSQSQSAVCYCSSKAIESTHSSHPLRQNIQPRFITIISNFLEVARAFDRSVLCFFSLCVCILRSLGRRPCSYPWGVCGEFGVEKITLTEFFFVLWWFCLCCWGESMAMTTQGFRSFEAQHKNHLLNAPTQWGGNEAGNFPIDEKRNGSNKQLEIFL